jgi:BirA family biotin operon repressor/biotin-[acetyl-CoA-carboxylase] ligase
LGYNDGYVVFSEYQTKYGSLGQPLPPDSQEHGVYLSCILRPSIFTSQVGFLGAMSAVAFITALEEQTDKRLGIGWVSDIFCEGERIGTTATEGKLDNHMTYEYIIISFSVKLSDEYFPPRLSDMIKKVFESENTSIPMIIAKNILSKFFALYPKKIKSPEKFMEIYKRKFALAGISAKCIENGKKKRCKVLGVEGVDGRLIIEDRRGAIKHISANRNIILPNKIKLKKQ